MISIDGYTGVERIGQGGLGDVYRATRTSTGATVAVKVLRDVSDQSVAWHRTRRELTALVSLAGHANVIQLMEVLDLPEGPALVMEFASGGSVAELMLRRDRPLSVGETALVGRQTATALVAAHARDIVHRDVKPQNLLIDAYGQVKLCDFGIAAMARSEEFQARTSAISMRYASPEDLDDEIGVGAASDVYSLGATMLHLARGAPPTLKERLVPWVPPPTDDEELAALDAVIASCLRPSPADRPTAAVVADELERLSWSIDERNRALAFEAVDLTSVTESSPDRGGAAPPVSGPSAEDAETVPRSALAEAARSVPPGSEGVEEPDDTVHRHDLLPARPPVRRGRRRWPIAVVATILTVVAALVVWPHGADAPSFEVVDRPAGLTDIRDLEWPLGPVGECLVQVGDVLDDVECTVAHDLQRFAVAELDPADFPDDAAADAGTAERVVASSCDAAFESYVGVSPDSSELQIATSSPSAASWESGDRTFQCLVGIGGRRVVGDAEASRR